MATPLTDAINALMTYANSVTGASDTSLSDAVDTLVAGYGGGGGGLAQVSVINVSASRSVQIDIDSTWFNNYDYVLIEPDLTFSASDWLYYAVDATTSNSYSSKITKADKTMCAFLGRRGSAIGGVWYKDANASIKYAQINVNNYLYWYLYGASSTMTGTVTIWGINL